MFRFGKYLDADKGGAGGGGEGGNSGGDGNNNTNNNSSNGAGAEGKTYTQDELNRLFGERASQAERSLLKKLGFEKVEDATSALTRLKTIDDGQKSDLQKAQEKITALEKSSAEQTEKQKEISAQYEVAIVAGKLGIVDPDAAYKLLDKSKLTIDEKTGKPTNTEQLLKTLLTEKPWLAGTGTSSSNPAKNRGDLSDPVVIAARRAAGLPVEEKK
jgi:hypothetical protein